MKLEINGGKGRTKSRRQMDSVLYLGFWGVPKNVLLKNWPESLKGA